MENRDCRLSQKRYHRRHGLAIYRDSRQHHLVPTLQEGRPEETMMGVKDWRFPGDTRQQHPVPKLKQGDKRFPTGDLPGIQQQQPVRKLQDGGQEENMTGDKDWRFPGTPGRTIRFPWGARGDHDGRQGRAISRNPRQRQPAPKLQEVR